MATSGWIFAIDRQSLFVANSRVPIGEAPDGALYLGDLDGEAC